ncbi:MAG TPA: hypothetical protein VHD56_10270 [Tepidisphaeraceae bacterium]|nr:hypothetical protein [Tepidisphaeraceae bacterium]
MAYNQDENSSFIITVGAVSGFLVIVIAIGLQAWFMSEQQSELESLYDKSVNVDLQDLKDKQRANLTTYRWIDKEKGIAAMPIDQAMKLLVAQKKDRPAQ